MLSSHPFSNPFLWFDLDGCQVDSEPVHEKRWSELARLYGVRLDAAHFDQLHTFPIPDRNTGLMVEITRPLRGAHEDIICHWILNKAQATASDRSALFQSMKRRLFPLYAKNANLVKPRAGMVKLIRDLSRAGYPMATVTGCYSDIANLNLAAMGKAARCMAFTVAAEHTTEHKPSPAPYLFAVERALRRLKRQNAVFAAQSGLNEASLIEASIAIDDSPSGVQSFLAAGMRGVQFLGAGKKPFAIKETPYDPARLKIARTADELREAIESFTKEMAAKPVPVQARSSKNVYASAPSFTQPAFAPN